MWVRILRTAAASRSCFWGALERPFPAAEGRGNSSTETTGTLLRESQEQLSGSSCFGKGGKDSATITTLSLRQYFHFEDLVFAF